MLRNVEKQTRDSEVIIANHSFGYFDGIYKCSVKCESMSRRVEMYRAEDGFTNLLFHRGELAHIAQCRLLLILYYLVRFSSFCQRPNNINTDWPGYIRNFMCWWKVRPTFSEQACNVRHITQSRMMELIHVNLFLRTKFSNVVRVNYGVLMMFRLITLPACKFLFFHHYLLQR